MVLQCHGFSSAPFGCKVGPAGVFKGWRQPGERFGARRRVGRKVAPVDVEDGAKAALVKSLEESVGAP